MIVVEKNDITTAYYESLSRLVDKWNPYPVLIQIEKPIIDAEIIVDPELNLKGLNIEKKMHDKFKEFEFEDGKKGKFWIKDRIKVLINDEGEYRRRLNKNDQLKHAIEILTKIRNKEVTWSSNRVICTVFNFRDLDWRRKPLPPCLVNIDFKPYKGSLNLVASWRAQYFDTKAYGNLISLAMLLKEMCEETNYRYGWISSIANKAIFKEGIGIAKELLKKMSEEP